MTPQVPDEVVRKVCLRMMPVHVALIQTARKTNPQAVPWDETHDVAVAAFATALYVAGLQQHLTWDEKGPPTKPADPGAMYG